MKTTINTMALTNTVAVAAKYSIKNVGGVADGDADKIVFEYLNKNTIVIKASDYSEAIMFKVPCSDCESFEAFSVNGKEMDSLLKKIAKNEDILLESTGEFILIKSGKAKAKIPKYASIPLAKGEVEIMNSVTLTKGFIEALKASEHSIDASCPKPELTGALIQGRNGIVKVVSTDTRRLSVQTVGECSEDFEMILPKNAISSLYKNCEVGSILNIGDSEVFVENEYQRYSSKKFNMKFVDYNKIVPKSYTQTFKVEKKTLEEVIKVAAALESKIMIDISSGRIKASDLNGSVETEKELETGNTNIKFSIESKFILDYLAVCTEDSIQIGFNEEVLPIALIQSPELCEIVMPITITK